MKQILIITLVMLCLTANAQNTGLIKERSVTIYSDTYFPEVVWVNMESIGSYRYYNNVFTLNVAGETLNYIRIGEYTDSEFDGNECQCTRTIILFQNDVGNEIQAELYNYETKVPSRLYFIFPQDNGTTRIIGFKLE